MNVSEIIKDLERRNREKTLRSMTGKKPTVEKPVKQRLKIVAATDGSCLGNPGVGGYAAVLEAKGKRKEITDYTTEMTTNNRMELQAIIMVVDWCNEVQKQPCEIDVYTDSQYIVNCHTHTKSWLTSEERPNSDLWAELIQKGNKGKHHLNFIKVKGHSGNEMNERADELATAAARRARHEAFG